MTPIAVDPEVRKEQVLTWLNANQKNKSDWFSCNNVSHGAGMNFDLCQKALYALATEGFLHIRHEPGSPDRLLYRVRRDGDDPQ